MELVIYGDFNCPFSALASDRAARLEAAGQVTVDWRAVEHDRSLPPEGRPVDSAARTELEREIGMIRDQLRPGESVELRPPTVLINTAALTASYAALAPVDRPHVRRQVFDLYWRRGIDIRDLAAARDLPAPTTGAATADLAHRVGALHGRVTDRSGHAPPRRSRITGPRCTQAPR